MSKPDENDFLPAAGCMAEVTREMHYMRDKLNDIHIAITGNPEMGHRGIVGRLDTVEKAVQTHDRKMLTWGGIVIGSLAVVEFLKDKILGHP